MIDSKFLDPQELNAKCRDGKAGFISTGCLGAYGFAFSDFGERHVITDADGENTHQFVISYIEKGKETVVTVHEDKRHSFNEGDYVQIREVEGMTQINDLKPVKVLKTTPFTFTLELDSSAFGDYKL